MSKKNQHTKKSQKIVKNIQTTDVVGNDKQRISKIIKIFAPICIALFLWSLVFTNTKHLAFDNDVSSEMIMRTLYILLSMALILYSFITVYKTTISGKFKNLLLVLYSTIIFFCLFEIIFMYAPISQGSGEAYSARLWFKKYWKVNELGYRDKSYDAITDADKTKIVMLGDSYIAGHGINNIQDRMSNILEKKLGDNYRIYNLGKNGMHTADEYANLEKFPFNFQYLILVHVPNDLDYINKKQANNNYNNQNNQPAIQPNILDNIAGFFVRESFFINFLSHTIIGSIIMVIRYRAWNENSQFKQQEEDYPFFDTIQMKEHISHLIWMDSITKTKNVKMMIVSFPFPGFNDTIADKYYNRFIHELGANNITYLDALPICNQLKPRKQIVSKLDMHPSKAVQKIVADTIYKRMITEQWIK